MNPHIDAVPLAHAGRTAAVRFSWRALQVIQRDWGDQWGARFADALGAENVGDMAELIAVTTGMTSEDVMEWSPPTSVAAKVLWEAYAITKLGREEANKAEAKTENPRIAQSLLLKASALLRFVRASAGQSSGSKLPTQPEST